ncbi:MAG: cupin domain-containing protein [Spirochaetales bacterium]|nr:cupin domain-containing protein [Spirochaetales bacterium]
MKISKAFDGEIVATKIGVQAQKIYSIPEAHAVHLTLDPGARLNTHTTPVDVFFYILAGEAWIEVGEEREAADKDCIIESPKNIPHAIENKSNENPLRVLFAKTPRP